MNILSIIISSAVGFVIGWFTNYLAIMMLFRPYNPIMIPVLNIEIQGLIPKRRGDIAGSLGEIVERELISINDIINNLIGDADREKILSSVEDRLDLIVKKKIPSYIPAMFKGMIADYVKKAVMEEVTNFIENDSGRVIEQLTERVNIKKIVEDKINGFELSKVEELALYAAGKELRGIEIIGGILGLVIGLVEGILVQVI
ncbi:MAG: DUF445 family protein [Thermoanaerobacteraceae bacterium]|nr:DUF445 family protein [Thermoanaerobacteraceae bacterium]